MVSSGWPENLDFRVMVLLFFTLTEGSFSVTFLLFGGFSQVFREVNGVNIFFVITPIFSIYQLLLHPNPLDAELMAMRHGLLLAHHFHFSTVAD